VRRTPSISGGWLAGARLYLCISVALLGGGTGVAIALAPSASAASTAAVACAGGSSAVRFGIDDRIARSIYNNELSSPEVTADIAHITGASDLVQAVSTDSASAALTAVTRLVYTKGWHIVRLRVVSSSGRVLADVGGSKVLAPVTGNLTSNGTVVGSYEMSVQDDRGYKKLVSGVVGDPMELYANNRPLEGSIHDPPSTPPKGKTLRYEGVNYDVDSYEINAFPSGQLDSVVLIPVPSAALAAKSCSAIRLAAVSDIVANVAAAFGPHSEFKFLAHTSLFVTDAHEYAAGPIFVLRGSEELAGSNKLPDSTDPAPPALPKSGTVTYESSQWLVYSFAPYPPDRIYVLQPA
jgi:hypothetical protein